MIQESEIKKVAEETSRLGGPFLSVYLYVSPADGANLSQKFEIALKSMTKKIREEGIADDRREAFEQTADTVYRYITQVPSKARSRVIICNAPKQFLWTRELMVPVKNEVYWQDDAGIRPLLELVDEYERFGVILTDRSQARIFTVFMGEIEEMIPIQDQEHRDVMKPATSGTDHIRSQKQNQRHGDVHALWHFKNVAEALERQHRAHPYRRLILAGQDGALSELRGLLPKHLSEITAGNLSISIHSKQHEVLGKALEWAREAERTSEAEMIQNLITMARKNGKAVLGVEPVEQAAERGQIRKLVYAGPLRDQLNRVSSKVYDAGGAVEEVKGEAADVLAREGGVGAFLRFTY